MRRQRCTHFLGSMMSWFTRLLACFVAVTATLFLLLTEAQAHAALVRSDPADGAVLSQVPERLQLVFSEPVSPVVMNLVGPTGEALRLDKFHLHDSTLVLEPPRDLARGSYVLSWRVTSADGHPIGGSVVFSVGSPSQSRQGTIATGSETLWPFVWATRVALYLGLFLGVGTLAFQAFIAAAPPPARRVSLTAIGVGLAALVPSAALQGLDLIGAPLDRLAEPEVWSAALSSTYMWTLIIGALAMAVGLTAWFVPHRWPLRILSVAALTGVGAALAASGHASAASPQWLTRPAVFLHGIGIAVWAGSLVPFALVLRCGGAPARRMVARFSTAILPVIGILVASGLVLAVVQVGHFEALWTTAYGRVFLAKLSLLLLLFTLAAINRFSLTPAYCRREPTAARQFVRSVRMEIVLVCAILAVASLWRFTPPPRSLAAAASTPASVHLHTAKAMAELTITPGEAGPVSASVYVMNGDFGPLEPKEVTLALSNPVAGIEPIRRSAVRIEPGVWEVRDLVLVPSGKWSVRVDMLISDFEKQTVEGTVDLR